MVLRYYWILLWRYFRYPLALLYILCQTSSIRQGPDIQLFKDTFRCSSNTVNQSRGQQTGTFSLAWISGFTFHFLIQELLLHKFSDGGYNKNFRGRDSCVSYLVGIRRKTSVHGNSHRFLKLYSHYQKDLFRFSTLFVVFRLRMALSCAYYVLQEYMIDPATGLWFSLMTACPANFRKIQDECSTVRWYEYAGLTNIIQDLSHLLHVDYMGVKKSFMRLVPDVCCIAVRKSYKSTNAYFLNMNIAWPLGNNLCDCMQVVLTTKMMCFK